MVWLIFRSQRRLDNLFKIEMVFSLFFFILFSPLFLCVKASHFMTQSWSFVKPFHVDVICEGETTNCVSFQRKSNWLTIYLPEKYLHHTHIRMHNTIRFNFFLLGLNSDSVFGLDTSKYIEIVDRFFHIHLSMDRIVGSFQKRINYLHWNPTNTNKYWL